MMVLFRKIQQFGFIITIVNNFELRRSFTKLRTSSHRLQIELGRYQGVPRHNRVCTKCSSNVIEDELHFNLNAQNTNIIFEFSKYFFLEED
jgi:hypothetical protein